MVQRQHKNFTKAHCARQCTLVQFYHGPQAPDNTPYPGDGATLLRPQLMPFFSKALDRFLGARIYFKIDPQGAFNPIRIRKGNG